jgi:hypothetical protein
MTPILRSLLTIALCLLINGADFAGELRHNLFVAKSCCETNQQLTDIVHTLFTHSGFWVGPRRRTIGNGPDRSSTSTGPLTTSKPRSTPIQIGSSRSSSINPARCWPGAKTM